MDKMASLNKDSTKQAIINFFSALSVNIGEDGIEKMGGKYSLIYKLLHRWDQYHTQLIYLFKKYLLNI